MAVTAAPRMAGAHGVRLTLILHYYMQCGYAGAGPVAVTFPTALKLPKQFATGAVTLAGKSVNASVDGHQVTVNVPRHKGQLCDLMGRGSLTLSFARAAKLANPAHAGSYRFKATHGQRAFAAELAIKPTS